MYNKPHVNVQKQKADFEINANIILNDFLMDPAGANSKYSGKIIVIKGKLMSAVPDKPEFKSILINSEETIVNCELDSSRVVELQQFTQGDQIAIKGIFIGYDDLLEELQMNNCFIVK